MKKNVIVFLFAILTLPLYSQNTIYLKNNTSLEFASMRLKPGLIKYKEDKNDKKYSQLNFEEIQYLTYYGKYFGLTKKGLIRLKAEQLTSETIKMGTLDACYYYSKYKASANGTFFTTFFVGGIIGLIPAISTSSTTPKEKNLNIPVTPFRDDPEYVNSYKKQAQNIKSKAVWGSYGAGLAAAIFFSLVVAGVAQ